MPPSPAVRRRTAPIHPRRISGPARPAAAVALPGRTGVFERLRGLPDSRAVDRLLRSRAWIWVVGAMLGGIVAMQVSLLRLNAGISRAVQTQDTLVRANSDLEAAIGQLTSGDRVRAWAVQEHMIDPPAGEARYLRARPAVDPLQALRRMKAPSDEARALMLSGGYAAGAAPVATPSATVSPVATPVATTTLSAVATPVPTPVATATPVVTPAPTAAVPTAVPGTGATQAPVG